MPNRDLRTSISSFTSTFTRAVPTGTTGAAEASRQCKFFVLFGHAVLVPRALLVSPDGLLGAAHPDPAVTAEMLRGLRDKLRLAGDDAARDHDVARAARDDAALDDAALDHDLRARRDAGHHLLGALHSTGSAGIVGCRLPHLAGMPAALQHARIAELNLVCFTIIQLLTLWIDAQHMDAARIICRFRR